VVVSRGMRKNFGVHWTRTLLGCFASLLMPVLFVLYVWVEKVRKVSRFAAEKMEGDGAERGRVRRRRLIWGRNVGTLFKAGC